MNSLKLTKVVCLGSLGCITAVSLYYHNNKDSISMEHLQQQQFKSQKIDSLKAENIKLRSQLGSVQAPMSATLNCDSSSKKKKTERLQWDQRSFTLYCDESLKEARRKNLFQIPEGVFPPDS